MKILYAVIFGALAGIIGGFLLLLPFIEQATALLKPLSRGIILGVIFGGFLGVSRALGDKNPQKIITGLQDGLVMGIAGGVASQLFISEFASGADKNLIFSVAGWAILGIFLGAGHSLDRPSLNGIIYGIAGGVIGGAIGGGIIGFISKGPLKAALWGQAFGLAALGVALGAALNIVHMITVKEGKQAAPVAVAPPAPARPAAQAPVQAPPPPRTPPAAPRPEVKAEPARPTPATPPPVQAAPVQAPPVPAAPPQPLKKWLEANFVIEKPQISIGSSPDSDIIIRAPGIEPKQALLYQEKGRFLIKNTGTSREISVSFTGDLIQGRNLAVNEFNALKEGSAIRIDKDSLLFFHDSPPSLSVRYPLDKPRIIIGTSPQNDIVLKDPGASARHAQITWEKERGLVTDLGSSSGTYVSYSGDKSQVRKIPEKNAITNNSLIRIGNVTFRVLG